MTHTGFFTRTPAAQNNTQTRTPQFVNFGKNLFLAVSGAFIDAAANGSRISDATLKTVLERFFAYYPKFKSSQPYLTPSERMGFLINGARKSDIVECNAFVLRQIAIDEIYANPLNYKEVFDGLKPSTSNGYLRDPEVFMPVSALRALTQSLAITLTLSHVEHGKELRMKEIYNNSAITSPKLDLALQVQGEQCFPKVKNKADFAYVGQLAINPPQPVENENEKAGTIADKVALIAEDNKRLIQSYSQWRKNLLTMLDDHELTTANLVNSYIKFLPENNMGFCPAAFFAKLTQSATPVIVDVPAHSGKQIDELLASSLASWISMDIIDADQLFEHLERPTNSAAAPAA